ncbi:protein DJ-1 homolog B-like [Durio zibethinus]|uniref:Protein DJ-1 homolog B-like n=1 Tax=Durio zibethinus TaxID=66656 RepID=A0A6P5XFY5_DURZI|nr:protein DJ-1 homolog B-like [Durio zibethinus]
MKSFVVFAGFACNSYPFPLWILKRQRSTDSPPLGHFGSLGAADKIKASIFMLSSVFRFTHYRIARNGEFVVYVETSSSYEALVPIGFGTEEMQAFTLVDVLSQAGAEVTVASVEPQLEIQASGGTRLVVDTTISRCSNQVFDLVTLPVSCSNL